jgi:hypothetical protein
VCARCPGMTPSDVSSLLSHLWRSLNEDSKMRYKSEEQKLRLEYENHTRAQPRPPPPARGLAPRSTTLDLPHLSADIITGEAPVVLPSLRSNNHEPPPPARVIAKRFDTAAGNNPPQ